MAYFASSGDYKSTIPSLVDGDKKAKTFGPDSVVDISDDKDPNNFFKQAYEWEPKYQHKFIMSIGDVSAFLIKSSAKPSLTNGEVVLDHINVKRKVKGKTSWNPIAITMYDAIIPSAAQQIMTWVRAHHESATGRDGYSSAYKKDITLNQLNGLGEIVEEWQLKGCYLQEVNFGALDWSSEDVVTIEATLNYDWAFLSY